MRYWFRQYDTEQWTLDHIHEVFQSLAARPTTSGFTAILRISHEQLRPRERTVGPFVAAAAFLGVAPIDYLFDYRRWHSYVLVALAASSLIYGVIHRKEDSARRREIRDIRESAIGALEELASKVKEPIGQLERSDEERLRSLLKATGKRSPALVHIANAAPREVVFPDI